MEILLLLLYSLLMLFVMDNVMRTMFLVVICDHFYRKNRVGKLAWSWTVNGLRLTRIQLMTKLQLQGGWIFSLDGEFRNDYNYFVFFTLL